MVFGTAGIPHASKSATTQAGVVKVGDLGLGCMEVEFVQGVRMTEASALAIAEVAARRGIRLTAHGPFFINLNAREEEKLIASRARIVQSARITASLGGEGVAFHAAFYLRDSPDTVYDLVKRHLTEIAEQLEKERKRVLLRPETAGKENQFGTLSEILRLSAEVPGVAPCIDIAHIHARNGKVNSYREFSHVLDQVEERLGRPGLDSMHIHVSGIEYGKHGEQKHLNLKESDFQYVEFLQALKNREAKGIVICESPNLEEDALLLQHTYRML